jgi:hypothetical protein
LLHLNRLDAESVVLSEVLEILDLPPLLKTWSNSEILTYMKEGVGTYRMKVMILGPSRGGKVYFLSLMTRLLSSASDYFG